MRAQSGFRETDDVPKAEATKMTDETCSEIPATDLLDKLVSEIFPLPDIQPGDLQDILGDHAEGQATEPTLIPLTDQTEVK